MLFQTILHIDDPDHEIFYTVLRKVNNIINYNAWTNAGKALAMLISKKLIPDIIFVDLNMPAMNGQQF